jgi:hypothetical protein
MSEIATECPMATKTQFDDSYLPSRRRIALECAKIQFFWSRGEKQRRWVGPSPRPRAIVHEYRIDDLLLGEQADAILRDSAANVPI